MAEELSHAVDDGFPASLLGFATLLLVCCNTQRERELGGGKRQMVRENEEHDIHCKT